VAREETLAAFQAAFATVGFVVCQDESAEPGFEKIAIFGDADGPQHVARQLPTGRWTSKRASLKTSSTPCMTWTAKSTAQSLS
jgi:hypothetical protein